MGDKPKKDESGQPQQKRMVLTKSSGGALIPVRVIEGIYESQLDAKKSLRRVVGEKHLEALAEFEEFLQTLGLQYPHLPQVFEDLVACEQGKMAEQHAVHSIQGNIYEPMARILRKLLDETEEINRRDELESAGLYVEQIARSETTSFDKIAKFISEAVVETAIGLESRSTKLAELEKLRTEAAVIYKEGKRFTDDYSAKEQALSQKIRDTSRVLSAGDPVFDKLAQAHDDIVMLRGQLASLHEWIVARSIRYSIVVKQFYTMSDSISGLGGDLIKKVDLICQYEKLFSSAQIDIFLLNGLTRDEVVQERSVLLADVIGANVPPTFPAVPEKRLIERADALLKDVWKELEEWTGSEAKTSKLTTTPVSRVEEVNTAKSQAESPQLSLSSFRSLRL